MSYNHRFSHAKERKEINELVLQGMSEELAVKIVMHHDTKTNRLVQSK